MQMSYQCPNQDTLKVQYFNLKHYQGTLIWPKHFFKAFWPKHYQGTFTKTL